MTTRQPGLRKRLELETRRISAQHRQLEAFYHLVVQALRRDDSSEARESFMRFRTALQAHFEVEERTEFPALHGLDPGTEPELDALIEEHESFRRDLVTLAERFRDEDLSRSARLLDDLARRLGEHEQREERLFQRSTDGQTQPERR